MTNTHSAKQLEFDEWLDLAINNPEGFEAARTAAIQGFLDSASPQSRQRLTGLQWRIDIIRQRSKTPMAACQSIYSMMWDRLSGEDGMLESLKSLANGSFNRPEPRFNDNILAFQPRLEEDSTLS